MCNYVKGGVAAPVAAPFCCPEPAESGSVLSGAFRLLLHRRRRRGIRPRLRLLGHLILLGRHRFLDDPLPLEVGPEQLAGYGGGRAAAVLAMLDDDGD